MNILLCIDDTDSIESRGTGELAEMISDAIKEFNWGKTQLVTRHQLLLHKDIPYTSHNSSMCFEAEIEEKYLQNIIEYASEFLERESEPKSDPGLCIVAVDYLKDSKKLIDFGHRAKKIILTKEDAYELAKNLNIHLSEHGGSGQGVIGALAGAGLRLSGNDGWFRGSNKINPLNKIIKVSELCSYSNIDAVRTIDGKYLEDGEDVILGKMVKSMLIEGRAVVLVDEAKDKDAEVKWKVCGKREIMDYEEMKLNVVKE